MSHDPAAVAAYVSGELVDDSAHTAFEEHLLACEECWSEVEAGRRGRELVERAREAAPDQLRERILATTLPRARRRPLLLGAAAACVAVVVAAIVVGVALHRGPEEPVAAAVAGYRTEQLPGSGMPENPAPDLSRLGFTATAAGTGRLAGTPVTAYAYRDQLGRRLLLYIGTRPFFAPEEVAEYAEPDASWLTHEQGIAVLCGRHPHVTLVVGQDDQLVREAAALLDVS